MPSLEMFIRAATPADFATLLQLNEGAIPNVNHLETGDLAKLSTQSCYFRLAEIDGVPVAFLLALAEGEEYESLNYRWFSLRYDQFVYVDRIVVAPTHARQGIGRKLYSDLIEGMTSSRGWLTCEVNLEPPNPNSLQFHNNLGFVQVGQQATDGGTKRVCLMAKNL